MKRIVEVPREDVKDIFFNTNQELCALTINAVGRLKLTDLTLITVDKGRDILETDPIKLFTIVEE